MTNHEQRPLPPEALHTQPVESLAERGLREGFMPLVPNYQGEDRNATARDETVVNTMGWSQEAGDTVIAHPPEAIATDGSEAPVADSAEAPAASDLLSHPDFAGLTGAALARAVLAKNGRMPTDPATRRHDIIARRANRFPR